MKRVATALAVLAWVAGLTACDDHVLGVPADPSTDALVYTPDWEGVTAMAEDHCQACHRPGGTADYLPLPDALARDLNDGTGQYVVPFEPDASRLWHVISGAEGVLEMPLGGLLAPSQVDHVRLWILDGAPRPTLERDEDGDGVSVEAGDCNDLDPMVFPGAEELCDGIDNNCDGSVDGADATGASAWYPDVDQDGYGDDANPVVQCDPPPDHLAFGGDCNDADAAFNPGVIETDCRDPSDYDCDGVPFAVDDDGDGSWACDDCDDADPTRHPGADELCDGIDQDCDGTADNDAIDTDLWYPDADQDGHGDATSGPVAACTAPYAGWALSNDDCNDGNPTVFPGATELCNGADNDCDGTADDGAVDQATWYTDGDGDGYGDDGSSVLACTAPPGTVSVGGDCDDTDVAYNPDVAETDCADPNDYNCDGLVGAVDTDGDGWFACEECDDGDPAVNPGAVEVCDGIDNDCAGGVDDGPMGGSWLPDADNDGFGDDNAVPVVACTAPGPGWVTTSGDCDDTDATANPSGTELCDGADNDCNGTADDGALDALLWFPDGDGDGEGAGVGVLDCSAALAGHALTGTDCDDGDPTIFSGADELCDGVDNDCSGVADDNEPVDGMRFYADGDGDGFGWLADPGFLACGPTVPGASVDNSDCDDGDATVNPAAAEVCDGRDNDCSGLPDDDAVDAVPYWPDADGDGYGDETVAGSPECTAPPGQVADGTDCDDTDAGANPGVSYDFVDGVDNDCDGALDEDGAAPTHAADIQPIWSANCTTGCHSGVMPSAGMNLTNGYTALVNVPASQLPTMDRVEPFDLANSYLWHKLHDTQAAVGGSGNQMPANGGGPPGAQGLSQQELDLIEAWIVSGAAP